MGNLLSIIVPYLFINFTIMTHEMPTLPYANDALEPIISEQTIEYHYGKHLQAYINNLNKLIVGTEYENMPLEEIVKKAPYGGIFNNAGQVMNHTLYFLQFSPNPHPLEKDSKLMKAIVEQYGSFEDFKTKFTTAAATLFGSGWAWLSIDKNGNLLISQEQNADIPIRHGRTPLLCFDVWEHAYYLDYQNRRPDYLNKIWDIIDWKVVEERMR